eukprot:scaffold168327_cov35-Tisochrysis_lutea.AAC.4
MEGKRRGGASPFITIHKTYFLLELKQLAMAIASILLTALHGEALTTPLPSLTSRYPSHTLPPSFLSSVSATFL